MSNNLKYDIVWQKEGVFVSVYENINNLGILYINGKIIGNKNFEKIKFQIWDFTDTKEFVLEETEAEEVAALDLAAMKWNKSCKIAIVTTNESLIAYVKKYQEEIVDTGWVCDYFKTLDMAIEWVNLIG